MNSTVQRLWGRLDRWIGISIAKTYLYELHANTPIPELPVASGVSLRVSSSPPFDEMKKFGWTTENDVQRRLRRGDVCYLAYLDGVLAHYSWVQFNGDMEIAGKTVTRNLDKGQFCIYDCCTAGWAKGQKIYPSVISRIALDYLVRGFSTALIYTTESNIASQNGIRRAGFKQCETLKTLRFGERHFTIPLRLT